MEGNEGNKCFGLRDGSWDIGGGWRIGLDVSPKTTLKRTNSVLGWPLGSGQRENEKRTICILGDSGISQI